jgi:hypothetical protein
MGYESKKRALYFGKVGGIDSTNNVKNVRGPSFQELKGLQHTNSWNTENYHLIDELITKHNRKVGKGRYLDLGHGFYTRRDFYQPISFFEGTLNSTQKTNGFPTYSFTGAVVPSNPSWSTAVNVAVPSSNQSLDAFGTNAIAKVRPTKPAYDSAVNVAELLREGLPKMIGTTLLKTKLKDARKLGDEYLNYQFGIMPLVGAIQDGFKTAQKATKLIEQIERDSGRVIRRRFIDDPIISEETQTIPNQVPFGGRLNFYLVGGPRPLTRVIRTHRQRWFSGAFTYHLPPDDSTNALHRMVKEAEMVWGARLNTEVLWNLTPWSWAADYVANAGNVIANFTAFSQEGLVMRYGYVMETTTVTITDTISVPRETGFGCDFLSHSYGSTVKVRRRATPYGFGLNEKDFSPYQWGIIGALGISNAPGRLR